MLCPNYMLHPNVILEGKTAPCPRTRHVYLQMPNTMQTPCVPIKFLGCFAHPISLAHTATLVLQRQYMQLQTLPRHECFYGTYSMVKLVKALHSLGRLPLRLLLPTSLQVGQASVTSVQLKHTVCSKMS
jgi:hypothetical protein